MKFFVAATLATSATAAVTVRDSDSIQQVLKNVGSKISALTSAIQGYKGGAITEQLSAGSALDKAINDGKTQIGTESLNLQEAFGLSAPVASLASLATPLVSALSVKRSDVEAAGSCSEVASLVNAVYDDGNALVSSVLNLVQADARPIATSLAAPLKNALASASANYASCKNSGNGGSKTSAAETSAAETSAAETSAAETSAADETSAAVTPTSVATPTGAATTPGTGVVPTAAAAMYAPAGALALAAAVLAL